MAGRLHTNPFGSYGLLSGELDFVGVQGNRLIGGNGRPLVLRGITIHGLDDPVDPLAAVPAPAGIAEADVEEICNSWGATVIRIPLNQAWVIDANGSGYLNQLDAVIGAAASRGAHSILSLRRLDTENTFGTQLAAGGIRVANYIAPRPNADSIGFWQILATRYADEPAVIFDLFSTPHAALDDDLTGVSPTWESWSTWVRMMVADIRLVHPRAVCVVSGLDWGRDLSGFPVRGTDNRPVPNLLYGLSAFPGRDYEPAWSLVERLGSCHPLFATELGGSDDHVLWASIITSRLARAGIGWTACSWSGDSPMVRDRWGQRVPTAIGAVVRRALAMEWATPGRGTSLPTIDEAVQLLR